MERERLGEELTKDGEKNWLSPSYNPDTGLLYVPTMEQCGTSTSSLQKPQPMLNLEARVQKLCQVCCRDFSCAHSIRKLA
jgi:hypothetical protein